MSDTDLCSRNGDVLVHAEAVADNNPRLVRGKEESRESCQVAGARQPASRS